MLEDEKPKRYIQEKIALAVILLISLLVARVMVEIRGVVRMTPPIQLSRSGLSVKMPRGSGWKSDGKWTYEDDSFAINSLFAVRVGRIQSYARCRYILASEQQAIEDRFSKDAELMKGEVVETGRMDVNQAGDEKLVIVWARISGEDGFEMMTGVCALAGGRELEIDVLETGDSADLAQNIFEKIVKGIQFNDDRLLQAGIGLVSEARQAGLNAIATEENQPVFLILYDSEDKAIGFTMDSLEIQENEEPAVRAANYFYVRVLGGREEAGLYRGDAAFGRFDWKFAESGSRTGRKDIEMSAESGMLTVRKSGIGGAEKEYVLSEAAVPYIILEPVLRVMLESDIREFIIDLIRPEGNVVPLYIERMNESDGNSIKLEILDGKGYRQRIYYDDTNRPVKVEIEQEERFTLNRATAEEVAKSFPEKAGLVLKRERQPQREGI
jgi:hypothetical protein